MPTRKPAQKKPTPIKAPEPIIFPTPAVRYGSNATDADERLNPVSTPIAVPHPEPQTQRLIPFPKPPISVELRNYIAHCIALTLYKVAEWAEAEIATMGQAQFEALCRSILEDDEA